MKFLVILLFVFFSPELPGPYEHQTLANNTVRNIKLTGRLEVFVRWKVITNANGLVVNNDVGPLSRFFLISDKSEIEMSYGGKGVYFSEVPEGIYDLKMTDLDGKQRSFRRSNFQIKNGKTTRFRLSNEVGELCYREKGYTVYFGHALRSTSYYKPTFETFLDKSPFNLVLSFCKKESDARIDFLRFVRITHKNFSVYAARAKINLRENTLEATEMDGELSIENGQCKNYLNKIVINLKKFEIPKFKCDESDGVRF